MITIENKTIKLNTNMTPEIFAKTRFSEKIKEKGVLAEFDGRSWNYSPWTFDGTEESGGFIILDGTAFEGKVAQWIFSSGTENEIHELSVALCNVLENAVESKAPLANIGAGGIIVSDDLKKILFLPYNFWTTAAMSAGDETFSTLNGIYINQNQDRKKALKFTQAIFVYKSIAGFFPFEEKDAKKRTEDILDENYSLLEWTVPCLNKKITEFTRNAFAGRNVVFPTNEFYSYEKQPLTEEEILKFKKNAAAAAAKKNKKITAKRFIRAKQNAIIAISVAAAVILIVAGNMRKTALEKPTSKGLSSIETVQMYYTALNELNVDAATNCTINLSSHVDAISNIFLKSRTRSMYDRQADTVPPSAWLIKNQVRGNIFGLTNFFINGKEGSLLVEGPRKNTRPKSITKEDGIQLTDGDIRIFDVQYICLDTTGEDTLFATKVKEKIQLTFIKDRWAVSSIETESIPYEFKLSEFSEDYLACMKTGSNEKTDVLEACLKLKKKYFFIPTEHEIDEGYEYLKKISAFNFD